MTYTLEIISKIKPIFAELLDVHGLSNGTRAVFKYEDGKTYEVIVRPIEEPLREEPTFDIEQGEQNED